MSDYSGDPGTPRPSSWAIGGLTFAAAILALLGVFQILAGLAAIFEDEFFVIGRKYIFDLDVTAWGWIHLLVGVALVVTGWALFTGKVWAAVTAIVLAGLSALVNFFFIPYYPWWSLLIIALDVWVIWSLTRPGVVRAD